MKKNIFAAICIAFVLIVGFTACKQDNNTEVTYKGSVVNKLTAQPFPNLEVKVTDGEHINQTVHTDAMGMFSLLVRFNEINSKYYLLIGDSSCVPVKKEFKGFGQKEIDLGIIEVEGPKAPTVETAEVTNIKSKMATGGGKVTSSGGFAVTKRGVCWGTSQYPTVTNDHTEDGTGAGEFFSNIGNLQPNTTYYVRAYAENEKGVAYGNQVMFRTESGVPTVTTKLVRVDGKTTVFYEGEVTDEGDSPVIARGVCWGTSTPNISGQKTDDGEGNGGYSGSITVANVHSQNLYFRAYATNESGTTYGEAIMIDHRNPYNLYKVTDGGVSYLVLPYDLETSTFDSARKKCNDLVAYDYDDWDLPSITVLELMWANKKEIGGFVDGYYWSSTLNYSSYYYVKKFYGYYDGRLDSYSGANIIHVRPVRQY